VQPRYRRLLESLEYVVELPDYVLVHACLNFTTTAVSAPLWTDREAMLTGRNHYDVNLSLLGGRPLLHGHVPQPLRETRWTLKAANPAHIGLDTGCVYYKNAGYGHLVALDLDTRQLHVQLNQDRPYAGGRK
jgi:serine/threonine protein phosphatase 1